MANNIIRARREEREAKRKLIYFLRSEEERLRRVREEEEARKLEEMERRKKKEAERKAKLDEIAEKQRQRERVSWRKRKSSGGMNSWGEGVLSLLICFNLYVLEGTCSSWSMSRSSLSRRNATLGIFSTLVQISRRKGAAAQQIKVLYAK